MLSCMRRDIPKDTASTVLLFAVLCGLGDKLRMLSEVTLDYQCLDQVEPQRTIVLYSGSVCEDGTSETHTCIP